MVKVVALSGWKGSGKDTAASYLIDELNYTRFAFADVLKEMVAEQYAIPLDWLHNNEFKELPLSKYPVKTEDAFSQTIHEFMANEFKEIKFESGDECEYVKCWTPRALAILEGSVKRSVNSQYWVQRVIDSIRLQSQSPAPLNYFVITDLRYKSEIKQLRDAFGSEMTVIRINRFDDCESTDPSERDLDDYKFDYVVENKTSLDALFTQVDEIINNP